MVVGDRSKSYSWLKFYYSIKLMIMLGVAISVSCCKPINPTTLTQWRFLTFTQDSPLVTMGAQQETEIAILILAYCSSRLFSNATIPA